MKFLVTPDFNEKLASLATEGLVAIAGIASYIKNTSRENLIRDRSEIEVRTLSSEILVLKNGNYSVFASFDGGSDEEYLILLDIVEEAQSVSSRSGFIATKDPRKNPTLDPNRNMTIDPRRNMTIDPRRNMTIDPNRNMTIDPRRNMTIDPRRNMTIDPNRNMTIDPRRNMTIDPNRNMTIDPRRNRYYGGPYLYDVNLNQEGFVVRANEEISLIFDSSARFTSYLVSNGKEGKNIFDVSGKWIGFVIPAKDDVLLKFDTSGQWMGIIV
ncbi:hypothetical protein [Thiocystis violascens]|uniref:Uncharacterized protein n=1 Tax=Thiocystis violascens (strain ATCC 17096 / DSM 198 / 6111) TaxID=765911 RepID=I3Y8E9_THIV6|nr:hypothetical protein [Thiocystis violascens]AFL73267.1 hypothetical protein Thivi_1244 [Thiocystis violascens DSM 198]